MRQDRRRLDVWRRGGRNRDGRRWERTRREGRIGSEGYESERDRREGDETGRKATGGKAMRAKAPRAQGSQETGGKGDVLMGEREMYNMLPGDTTLGQNPTEGIRQKSYSEVVI